MDDFELDKKLLCGRDTVSYEHKSRGCASESGTALRGTDRGRVSDICGWDRFCKCDKVAREISSNAAEIGR